MSTRKRSAFRVLSPMVITLVIGACSARELPESGVLVACCEGRGSCMASGFLEERYLELLGRESCSSDAMCVPDELQSGTPAACTVQRTKGEGRCLPSCLPAVQAQSELLAQDGCEDHQRCVPCYDPFTGESTGACDIGGDSGPKEPPATFAQCCEGVGRCVNESALSTEQREPLGRDSCAVGSLCAPEAALRGGADYVPASCSARGFETEGRCLPECLPAIAAQRARLGRQGCPEHHLCAPCFDPITGDASGSCDQGSDRPAARPVTVDACCGGIGHCIPKVLVPDGERERLDRGGCRSALALCVPDVFAASDFQPSSCTASSVGVEGRCLPRCLPQLASQLDLLAQDGCDAHQVCAPCIDPLSGEVTGACGLGSDRGPSDRAVVFDSCCEGRGRCLPEGAVPSAQREQLAQNSCAQSSALCVPNELANAAQYVPSACTVSALAAEGRCLSVCLPAVAERASVLARDGCAESHACVPCFDPITGESSGACGFAGDPGPSQSPVLLGSCCAGLGRCTPRAWVPGDLAQNFGPDSCAAVDDVCVAPAAALDDPEFVPASCEDATTGAEGRCLPACLPAVAPRAAALSRSSCAQDNLCVPCFDPLTGLSTGACAANSDPGPTRRPVIFETCCGGEGKKPSGICVPSELLPEDAPELPRQSCAGEDEICAPRVLVEDSRAKFPACDTLSNGPGVCIESCYLNALARAVSPRRDCLQGSNCVACSLLGSEIGGCSAPAN